MTRWLWIIGILTSLLTSLRAASPEESVSLEQCIAHTLRYNPELRRYPYRLQAQEGWIEQAGALPNPEVELEAENILGSGEFRQLDGIEATFLLKQRIELGGKRDKRLQVAANQRTKSELEYLTARYDAVFETIDAYYRLLAAQEREALFIEFVRLSETVYDIIDQTVQAGRDSPLEKTRARISVSSNRIKLKNAQRERERRVLALWKLWGYQVPAVTAVDGLLVLPDTIEPLDRFIQTIDRLPELRVSNREIDLREAEHQLEIAQGVQDIEIGAGVRYLAESSDGAFVLGLSIPLPLFDTNQGAIRATERLIEQAKADRAATENEIRSSIDETYQTLLETYEESTKLEQDILPAAEQAFEASQLGYREGKFPYIDVLDSQRSLFESRVQRIDSLENFYTALNRLNRLSANYEPFNLELKEMEP